MKKKKQIKKLKLAFNMAVRRNFELLKENANLRCANDDLLETNNYMNSAGTIAKLEQELKSSKALASELGKENAHLRTENDIARAQLQDAQEKMRTPVFVPIK